jgi:hypothetical protein
MIIRGDAVVKLLIAQSNRGHDIGAEGIWDSVSAHTIEEINQLNSSQRKEAHKEKRLKRLSMWDQTLDQGHVKKIKKISSSEVDYHDALDSIGIPRWSREPYKLPKININTEFWPTESGSCGEGPIDAIKVFESFKDDYFCKCLLDADIQFSNYQYHSAIKAPLSN